LQRAVHWFKRPADQGYAAGQYEYGIDMKKSSSLFHAYAQYNDGQEIVVLLKLNSESPSSCDKIIVPFFRPAASACFR
jgi:TPR repeat protein